MAIDFIPEEQFDFQPDEQAGVVNAAQIQTEEPAKSVVGKLFGKPTARPELTVGEEFTGGLGDIARAFEEHAKLSPDDPRRFLLGPEALLGAVRSAASPLAPATNLATQAGERVSDITSRIPGFGTAIPGLGYSLADILAGGTAAIGDFVLPAGAIKGAQSALRGLRTARPLRSEQVAAVKQSLPKREAAITEAAEAESQQVERLATAQTEQIKAAQTQQVQEAPAKITAEARAQEESILKLKKAQVEQVKETVETAKGIADDTFDTFVSKTVPARIKTTKEAVDKAYNPLLEKGGNITQNPANLQGAVDRILGEQGAFNTLRTKAESTAGRIKSILDAESDAEDILAQSKDLIGTASINKDSLKQFLNDFPSGETPSIKDLILLQKKFRAAGRTAFKANNQNLARQFNSLEQAVTKDIAGAPGIAEGLTKADNLYRTQFVPIVRNGLQASFDLKTGLFRKDRFLRWWDTYMENPEGRQILRNGLEGDFEDFQNVVKVFKTTQPKTLESTAAETIRALEKRASKSLKGIEKQKLERLGTLEKQLSEGEDLISGIQKRAFARQEDITATRDNRIKALQKEITIELKKLGVGKPSELKHGMFVGQVALVHGVSTLNPPVAITGGLVMLAAPHIVKLMNSARGLQLFNRALRTVPGTVQASAQARLIQNFLQKEDSENGK